MDKKIRFVGEDTGVTSYMKRLRDSADELARGMIRGAREYSTSSKEVIADLREQISLMERRIELDQTLRTAQLKKKLDTGDIGKTEFLEGVRKISSETEEYKLQIILLKELIETVRQTSKEEIREDRKGVEERLKRSDTLDVLGPEGDEKELLKETFQREMLGTVGESEVEEREKWKKYLAGGGSAVNTVASLGTQKNEMYALAAALTLIPIVGKGLSNVAGKLLGSAEKYEASLGSAYQVMGTNEGQWGYKQFTKFGLSPSDVISAKAQYGRANIDKSYWGGLELERGLGIERSQLINLAKTQRGTGELVGDRANELLGTLINVGLSREQARAYAPEYIDILIDVNKKQLEALGRVDSGINTKMISSIKSLDTIFDNPEILKGVVSAFEQGLSKAATPQIEALQYQTLSSIAPDKDLWELRKMKASPFENEDYLPTMLKKIIEMSGSRMDALFNIEGWLGTTPGITEAIYEGIINEKLKTGKDIKLAAGFDTEKEAAGATQILGRATASTDAWFETNGEKVVSFMDDSIKAAQKLFSRLDKSGTEETDAEAEYMNNIKAQTLALQSIDQKLSSNTPPVTANPNRYK